MIHRLHDCFYPFILSRVCRSGGWETDAPHLKMKPQYLKKQTPPPLKRETPFHEMILRKSTINNNLKSN